MMPTQSAVLRLLAVAALTAGLSGCSNDMSELQSYIDQIKARPGGRIDPLPAVRPAPLYAYAAGDRRSPFTPDAAQRTFNNNPNAVRGPDPNRPPEFLEQFPLDTMRMVGTLSAGGRMVGLVQTTDGLVHRVAVGNYLGQNFGRITSITDSQIQLTEIVPDGLGGYMEQPAAIGLSD